jgi:hypothetical protein
MVQQGLLRIRGYAGLFNLPVLDIFAGCQSAGPNKN